jgi:hypothetical protein
MHKLKLGFKILVIQWDTTYFLEAGLFCLKDPGKHGDKKQNKNHQRYQTEYAYAAYLFYIMDKFHDGYNLFVFGQ